VADRSRIDCQADDRRLTRRLTPPFHVVADTHFGHTNLCRPDYENRPYDHNTLMRNAWQNAVGKNDWIVHLGDVTLWRDERAQEMLDSLPGRKVLIYGNHDRKSVRYYRDLGFEHVCRGFELHYGGWRVLFSHRPDREHQFVGFPRRLNVHGHVHSKTLADRRFINCSVEATGYAPVAVTDLLDTRIAELCAGGSAA
jgi:calcineurin-like phosphoesterase family protein